MSGLGEETVEGDGVQVWDWATLACEAAIFQAGYPVGGGLLPGSASSRGCGGRNNTKGASFMLQECPRWKSGCWGCHRRAVLT